MGPFRLSELLAAGMRRDTLVWSPGSETSRQAHKIPILAKLFDDEWRRHRKASRKARRLPEPETFGKLRLAILCVNAAAGLFFIIGSAALLTSLVLMFGTPDGTLLALLAGLTPAVLGLMLLLAEAGLVGAFIWNCLRIVKVLAPDQEGSDVTWRDFLELDLNVFDKNDDSALIHRIVWGMVFLFPIIALFCIVFGAILMILLPVYGPFAISIYRLGYGLNNVVDRYRLCDHGVPWAPIPLGFFTAASGLLLVAGPLSVPFFVLLPIWVFRTAKIAAAICRTDPARFVENKQPAKAPVGPPPSPLDIPQNAGTRS